eukprot:695900-Amphidinium_carterae.1
MDVNPLFNALIKTTSNLKFGTQGNIQKTKLKASFSSGGSGSWLVQALNWPQIAFGACGCRFGLVAYRTSLMSPCGTALIERGTGRYIGLSLRSAFSGPRIELELWSALEAAPLQRPC